MTQNWKLNIMNKSTRVLDALSLIFSLFVVGAAGAWILNSQVTSISLTTTQNASWYLIRSAGVTSYVLLTIATLWGLALTSKAVKDWSPGVLSMLLHSTLSWLAVGFGLGHALLLMVDSYFSYTIQDVLVPFIGPYRPLAVGLGTLTFWIILMVSASFAIKRFIGHRVWKTLHFSSYIAFFLATLHGLTAGSDAENMGFRLIITLCVSLVLAFSAYRLLKVRGKANKVTRVAQSA